MNLFENLQIMTEYDKRAEELVNHDELRDAGMEFYENGRGELIVKTFDDPIPLEVEVKQNDGKWFVTLPSEDINATDIDLTRAIIAAVNKISEPPFMQNENKSNESTNDDFVKQESKEEPEEIIEWDDDVFDNLYDDGEEKTEAAIVKNEKDMEQIVENKESLTEDSADPKEELQIKANKFGAMIDALAEDMSEFEINEFLKGLTDELDMDVYEDGEPYPSDLDGYFGEPVANLNLNDANDAEMFDWVDNILTDCINKTVEFIKGRIETLKGEISALETSITDLETLL